MATSISPATSASGIPASNPSTGSSSSNIINRPMSGMCGGISSPVVLTIYYNGLHNKTSNNNGSKPKQKLDNCRQQVCNVGSNALLVASCCCSMMLLLLLCLRVPHAYCLSDCLPAQVHNLPVSCQAEFWRSLETPSRLGTLSIRGRIIFLMDSLSFKTEERRS